MTKNYVLSNGKFSIPAIIIQCKENVKALFIFSLTPMRNIVNLRLAETT